jgi:hypothetical protein
MTLIDVQEIFIALGVIGVIILAILGIFSIIGAVSK